MRWNTTQENRTISKAGITEFTWLFPTSFSTILYAGVMSAQSLTTYDGSTGICCINHCSVSEIQWFVKNNSRADKAYSRKQFVYIIGI